MPYLMIKDLTLNNDIVSFEQLGPDDLQCLHKNYVKAESFCRISLYLKHCPEKKLSRSTSDKTVVLKEYII